MPSPEDLPERGGNEPFIPSPLPEELAEFLKDKDYVGLLHGTDQGTVVVIKVPGQEIVSVRGRVATHIRHELHRQPAAPVIRTVVKIYDQPDRPLALESFTNIDDEIQRTDFAALANQKTLLMLFYDEALSHRLTKRVPYSQGPVVAEILGRAERMRAAIAAEDFDFDGAKREVLRHTTL